MWSVASLRAAIVCLALALAAAASAQHRVWIVDVQNRPGTDFTDLQLAVDQVPLGDILDVRDGAHGPYRFTVRRGVTIQFRAGAGLAWSSLTASVPAGQHLVISALRRANAFPASVWVDIGPSAGTIALHNCALDLSWIRGARQVTLVGGSSSSLNIEDSNVAITGCNIVGFHQTPPPGCGGPAGPLYVLRSHVTIDASSLAPGSIDPSCPRWDGVGAIVVSANSSVYLTRGTTAQGWGDLLRGDATSGFVVLDPSIAALTHSPALRVERRVVPALHIEGPAVGQTANGALHAAGALGACAWLGRPIAAVALPGLSGAWAVDPIESIMFLCGVPQNGVLGFAIAVPGNPALVGEVIALQGLAWLPGMTVTTWVVELIRG